MDQSTILILVVAAMMAQKPAPACNTIAGAKPAQQEIQLEDPSVLLSADKERLRPLVEFMLKNGCSVTVQGYREPGAGNKQDDETRANTVKTFLTRGLPDSQRVRFNQVTTKPMGELKPLKKHLQTRIVRVVP